jgi:hypothetical protein
MKMSLRRKKNLKIKQCDCSCHLVPTVSFVVGIKARVLGPDPRAGTGTTCWDQIHVLGPGPRVGTGTTCWDQIHVLGQDPCVRKTGSRVGTTPSCWGPVPRVGTSP